MRRKILLAALTALLLAALAAGWNAGMAAEAKAKWPKTSSSQKTNGKMKLDVGNSSEGYFMAAVSSKTKHKMKLRVVKGDTTLNYDLNGDGAFEVFPFQLGSGKYEISLWENVSGKKYSAAGKVSLTVKLKAENICFLYPNQYVNYSKKTAAVAKANELCSGMGEKDAYNAIKKFISNSFTYDYVKAATIKPSVMPDLDGCYSKQKGVCQDLSAVMVCMLRSQGIPARLVVGYADKNYHAWLVVEVDGKKVLFDPTAAVSHSKNASKYTVERYY